MFRRSIILAVFGGSFAIPALAQSGAPMLLMPFEKNKATEFKAQSTHFGSGANADASDQDFDLSIYDASGRYTSESGSELGKHVAGAAYTVGFNFTYMATDLEEENSSSARLPDQLIDQSVSFGMTGIKYSDWEFAWQLGVGYAGASVFNDGDAWYGLGTATATRVLSNEPGRFEAITLLVDYDGNRSILPDVPLPGFLYTRELNEQFTLNLGFPFLGLTWKPTDKLKVIARYALPDYSELRVRYEFVPRVALFANLDSRAEAFHSNTLDNNRDRILFIQRRIEGGLDFQLCDNANFQIAGGYAFSQEFSQGFDSRDDDKIFEPTDEPYVRTSLEVKW